MTSLSVFHTHRYNGRPIFNRKLSGWSDCFCMLPLAFHNAWYFPSSISTCSNNNKPSTVLMRYDGVYHLWKHTFLHLLVLTFLSHSNLSLQKSIWVIILLCLPSAVATLAICKWLTAWQNSICSAHLKTHSHTRPLSEYVSGRDEMRWVNH